VEPVLKYIESDVTDPLARETLLGFGLFHTVSNEAGRASLAVAVDIVRNALSTNEVRVRLDGFCAAAAMIGQIDPSYRQVLGSDAGDLRSLPNVRQLQAIAPDHPIFTGSTRIEGQDVSLFDVSDDPAGRTATHAREAGLRWTL
jgi:hypothetical protein